MLNSFLSLLTKYDFLILDLRFKNIHIISSFGWWEKDVSFVEKYDRKSLYPMLVKSHEHLHYLMRLVRNYANQDIYLLGLQFGHFLANYKYKNLLKRSLLIFRWYQLDVKDIKCPLQWWKKHETMFFIVGFLCS